MAKEKVTLKTLQKEVLRIKSTLKQMLTKAEFYHYNQIKDHLEEALMTESPFKGTPEGMP